MVGGGSNSPPPKDGGRLREGYGRMDVGDSRGGGHLIEEGKEVTQPLSLSLGMEVDVEGVQEFVNDLKNDGIMVPLVIGLISNNSMVVDCPPFSPSQEMAHLMACDHVNGGSSEILEDSNQMHAVSMDEIPLLNPSNFSSANFPPDNQDSDVSMGGSSILNLATFPLANSLLVYRDLLMEKAFEYSGLDHLAPNQLNSHVVSSNGVLGSDNGVLGYDNGKNDSSVSRLFLPLPFNMVFSLPVLLV